MRAGCFPESANGIWDMRFTHGVMGGGGGSGVPPVAKEKQFLICLRP